MTELTTKEAEYKYLEISTKEAAEIKGVKIGTVYGWISAGIITRPITKEQLDAMQENRRGVKLNDANRELVQSDDLSCLTEYQQAIITLHYIDGKTLQEIADERGVSRAAIKNAEDRALKKLIMGKLSPVGRYTADWS